MKVFISWSGDRSKQLAVALRDFLPEVFQECDAWMSAEDITAGVRWTQELTVRLSETLIGVISLTPENLSAPWLLFEAGALSKSIAHSRVIPYRLGLVATDVPFPLAQFQGVDADEDGTRKLLDGLNSVREKPMPPDRLGRIFTRWWPDLARRIAEIPNTPAVGGAATRTDRALLEEVLDLARSRFTVRVPVEPNWEKYAPRDTVWKTIHDVTEAEMKAMAPETLRNFISAMRTRLDAVQGGEEAHLDGRIATAEQCLKAMREKIADGNP